MLRTPNKVTYEYSMTASGMRKYKVVRNSFGRVIVRDLVETTPNHTEEISEILCELQAARLEMGAID